MKRFIITFVTILVCFLLQTTFFQSVALAGQVPNLILIVVVAAGYMRGRMEGLYVGFASGLLIDFIYSDLIGMNAMLYVMVGYIAGICNEIYYRDELSVPLLVIALSDFLFNFVFYVLNFLLRGRTDVVHYIWRNIVPEMVYTVLIAVALYQLLHTIYYRLDKKESEEVI